MKKLIQNGYKKYVSSGYNFLKNTDTLFQKKVVDDTGIRYFIDCWWYPEQKINSHFIEKSWQFEVQFYDNENNVTMNVMLFEKDVAEAEKQFDNIWKSLKLGYYENTKEIP